MYGKSFYEALEQVAADFYSHVKPAKK
jgi:hypothetical protein